MDGIPVLNYNLKNIQNNSVSELKMTITCNWDGNEKDKMNLNPKLKDKVMYITTKHKLACPKFNFSYLYEKYWVPLLILYIVLGIFCTFFGNKLFKFVLFIIVFIGVTFLIFMIFYQTLLAKSSKANTRNLIISLCISAVIGITAGVLIIVFNKFGFFVAGGAVGVVVSLLVYTGFLSKVWPMVILHGNL